jgi:hypothetical protein
MSYFNTREELIEYIEKNLCDFIIGEGKYTVRTIKFETFPVNCVMLREYFIGVDKRNNKWKIRNLHGIDLSLEEVEKLAELIEPLKLKR